MSRVAYQQSCEIAAALSATRTGSNDKDHCAEILRLQGEGERFYESSMFHLFETVKDPVSSPLLSGQRSEMFSPPLRPLTKIKGTARDAAAGVVELVDLTLSLVQIVVFVILGALQCQL